MIKINLETALIKENRTLITPKELLFVKEYDKHTDLVENDALKRIGLNDSIKKGQNIKNRITSYKEQTMRFNQERVFHITQIEKLCNKYRLKFLETSRFKGIIDSNLPNKISTFEIAYGVKCNNWNTKIVAPPESFKLEERPKDPLLFYQINEEYYYLIHKWGNDLSVFRSILPLFASTWFSWISTWAPFLLLCFWNVSVGISLACIAAPIAAFASLMYEVGERRFWSWIRPNYWDSHYRD